MIERRENRPPLVRIVIRIVCIAFLLIGNWLAFTRLPELDFYTMFAALIFLSMSLMIALVHTLRPQDAPQPLRPVSQVLSYLMGGLALLIPMTPAGWLAPKAVFALFLIAAAGSLVASWRVWGAADELMRTMLKDSYVLASAISGGVLCVYAAGERLGVLSGATFWGYFIFSTIVSIFSSVYTIGRHGQDKFLPEEPTLHEGLNNSAR